MKATKRLGASLATAVAALYTAGSAYLDKLSLDNIPVQQITYDQNMLRFANHPDYGTAFDAPWTTINVVRNSGQVESMSAPTFFERYAWGKLGDLTSIKEIVFKESNCPLPSQTCQDKMSVQQLQDFLNYWGNYLHQSQGREVITQYGQANSIQNQLTNITNQSAQLSSSLNMKLYFSAGLIAMESAILTYPLWGWRLKSYISHSDFYKGVKGRIDGHSKTVARNNERKMNHQDLEEGMLSFPFSLK